MQYLGTCIRAGRIPSVPKTGIAMPMMYDLQIYREIHKLPQV